jgi:hypothetical protein
MLRRLCAIKSDAAYSATPALPLVNGCTACASVLHGKARDRNHDHDPKPNPDHKSRVDLHPDMSQQRI